MPRVSTDNAIAWKANIRLARSLVTMCLMRLEPSEVMSTLNCDAAKFFHDEAEKGECAAWLALVLRVKLTRTALSSL